MFDTPRLMASNRGFMEMGVKSSTWPLFCCKTLTEKLRVCRRSADSLKPE